MRISHTSYIPKSLVERHIGPLKSDLVIDPKFLYDIRALNSGQTHGHKRKAVIIEHSKRPTTGKDSKIAQFDNFFCCSHHVHMNKYISHSITLS